MKNSIFILLAIVLLSACATKREKAIAYMTDNQEDLAILCAAHFKPVIEYKPGVTIHKTDTQYVEGEPIPCPPNEAGEVVYVRGRDKVIRDTVWRTDTATVKDVAFEAVLRTRERLKSDSLVLVTDSLFRVKKQRNTAYWALGIIGLIGIGSVLVRRWI